MTLRQLKLLLNPLRHSLTLILRVFIHSVDYRGLKIFTSLRLRFQDFQRWYESQSGHEIDIIAYKIPKISEEYFHFFDITHGVDNEEIDTEIAKDIFILGYPFSKHELNSQFKKNNYFSFPIWKKGTIATEPKLLLDEKIILIDSLSRPGMSGAPVVITEESDEILSKSQQNIEAFEKIKNGDVSGILSLDTEDLIHKKKKKYNLLGIYSGVIGSSRLKEVALGKCWEKQLIFEIFTNPKGGEIPFHKPEKNEFYERFYSSIYGKCIFRNFEGEEIDIVEIKR